MMRSRLVEKAVSLAATLCLAVPAACSSSESKPGASGGGQAGGPAAAGAGAAPVMSNGGTGGGGGAGSVMLPPGTSESPKTIQCGGDCTSARVGLIYADPCCSGESDDVCGIDTSYLTMTGTTLSERCEPKDQPGELDAACPSPEPTAIDVMGSMATLDAFPGCCRPNGTCGVALNTVTAAGGLLPVAELGLGCVDAAPFFPGQSPVPCTEAAAGAGGAGGAGGSAGAGGAGPDGAGGAP